MIAKINTKSNFRDLNDTFLKVKEIVGTRVSCTTNWMGKEQTIDFKLTEISEIYTDDKIHPIFQEIIKTL